MFSVMELRIISSSIQDKMLKLQEKLKILDVESDEAVEATNDLMIYQNILEKISNREDV